MAYQWAAATHDNAILLYSFLLFSGRLLLPPPAPPLHPHASAWERERERRRKEESGTAERTWQRPAGHRAVASASRAPRVLFSLRRWHSFFFCLFFLSHRRLSLSFLILWQWLPRVSLSVSEIVESESEELFILYATRDKCDAVTTTTTKNNRRIL